MGLLLDQEAFISSSRLRITETGISSRDGYKEKITTVYQRCAAVATNGCGQAAPLPHPYHL